MKKSEKRTAILNILEFIPFEIIAKAMSSVKVDTLNAFVNYLCASYSMEEVKNIGKDLMSI